MKQETEYERRLNRHYDELKWLYCELYENGMSFLKICVEKCRKIQIPEKGIKGTGPQEGEKP